MWNSYNNAARRIGQTSMISSGEQNPDPPDVDISAPDATTWDRRALRNGQGGITLAWLFYRSKDGPAVVILVEASSPFEARRSAIEAGLEVGLAFARAQMLDAEQSALINRDEIGRLLPLHEASRIIERFEAAHDKRAG
jgi:hypothetical protein